MLFCLQCFLLLSNGHCAHLNVDETEVTDQMLNVTRQQWAWRLSQVQAKGA